MLSDNERNKRIQMRQQPGRSSRARNAQSAGVRKRSGRLAVPAIIALLLTGVLTGFALSMLYNMKSAELPGSRGEASGKTAAYTVSENTPEGRLLGIKESFINGNSVISTLRRFYPEDIVFMSEAGYRFVPFNSRLKQHKFKRENVDKRPDGTWVYKEGNKTVSHKGIDISSHQGRIDWDKVRDTDVEFVMIRALYRGYETGKLVEDKNFRENLEGAEKAGKKVGLYIFTQAVNEAEVEEEFRKLKELMGKKKPDYPVVIDIEDVYNTDARMDLLDAETRTALVQKYIALIASEGWTPMIYFNIEGALSLLKLEELEDCPKWYASYSDDFYYPYAYDIWQYSETGRINGIEGDVDLDMSFTDFG